MVKLIWVTPEAEERVIHIARVSSDQTNTDPKLLNYLIRNKHWSPFEMVDMCVEINTSRAISRQILRHRSFHFQEFSQRYSEPTGFEWYGARRQAEKNRQSSIDDLSDEIKETWFELEESVFLLATEAYNNALELGIAKEVARFILPEAASTKLYMKGTIRDWIHYINLRTDEHTQLEHRDVANEIKKIFITQFPIISEALEWIEENHEC